MSINIPDKLVDLSDFVGVRLNTDKMSTRMRNSIKRMLERGHVEGFGTAGQIAFALRMKHALPTIRYGRGWIKWTGMKDNEALFATLTALHTAITMSNPDSGWRWKLKSLQELIDKRKSAGHAYLDKYQKPMFMALKLPAYPDVFDGLVEVNMKKEYM